MAMSKVPKVKVWVDKRPVHKDYRVQITQGENFLGKRIFKLRKDAEVFAKKTRKKYK